MPNLMSLYSLLPSSEPSFRLLRVLPSRISSSCIQCELTVASIKDSVGHYVAGSYVWGPRSPVATIRVNGIDVEVRQNLTHFLRACRRKWHPFVVWIDAICINQDDLAERSNQVGMMDKIYKSTQAVHCWLGSSIAVATALKRCDAVVNRALGVDLLQEMSATLDPFVQCEYWTRAWIVQEFVLAHDVLLMAGPIKVPLQSVSRLLSVTAYHDIIASRIFQLRNRKEQKLQPHSFEYLFDMFCKMGCAVPKDRLFALIGIVGREESILLRPIIDYNLSAGRIICLLLETGLIQNYSRFMQHADVNILQHGPDQESREQLSLLYRPCSYAVTDNLVRDPQRCHIWRSHTYAPCHPPAWSGGVRISKRWWTYLAHSYEILQFSHRVYAGSRVHVRLLLQPCAKDCSPCCNGHAIAGTALILEHRFPGEDSPIVMMG